MGFLRLSYPSACSHLRLGTITGHRAAYTSRTFLLFFIDIIECRTYYTDQYYCYDDIGNYTTHDISRPRSIEICNCLVSISRLLRDAYESVEASPFSYTRIRHLVKLIFKCHMSLIRSDQVCNNQCEQNDKNKSACKSGTDSTCCNQGSDLIYQESYDESC